METEMVPREDYLELLRERSSWGRGNLALRAQLTEARAELLDATGTLEAVAGELGSIVPSGDYDTVVSQAEAVKAVVSGLEGELEDTRAELANAKTVNRTLDHQYQAGMVQLKRLNRVMRAMIEARGEEE